MSAADLALVLVTLTGMATVVSVAVATWSLLRTLREVRLELARVRRETLPLLHDLRDAVVAAGAEVARVDELVERAEEVTATMEVSSRVVDAAVTGPLIKIVATVRGIGRATRRTLSPWRRRRGGGGRVRSGASSRPADAREAA